MAQSGSFTGVPKYLMMPRLFEDSVTGNRLRQSATIDSAAAVFFDTAFGVLQKQRDPLHRRGALQTRWGKSPVPTQKWRGTVAWLSISIMDQ